jgi:hypothetical protein
MTVLCNERLGLLDSFGLLRETTTAGSSFVPAGLIDTVLGFANPITNENNNKLITKKSIN